MGDCADILPRLIRLSSIARHGRGKPTEDEIMSACKTYECAMMPRAFKWVAKSGGTSLPVSRSPIILRSKPLVSNMVHPTLAGVALIQSRNSTLMGGWAFSLRLLP
jgi:hypothetical protein